MLAVDTNVVVRCLVNDDPRQSAQARALIATERIKIPTTVIQETAWVLRKTYLLDTVAIADALRLLAGMPTITLEAPLLVANALDWFGQGMDFADALHLAASEDCEAMVSFDTKFAKTARRLGAPPVRLP